MCEAKLVDFNKAVMPVSPIVSFNVQQLSRNCIWIGGTSLHFSEDKAACKASCYPFSVFQARSTSDGEALSQLIHATVLISRISYLVWSGRQA